MKKALGFSLIELLIVLAILAIIAALAVPRFVDSRKAGNEASAIASVRTITTAQFAYWANGRTEFAANLADLEAEELVDSSLGSGQKDGYSFVVAGVGETFTISANPVSNMTGTRHFFTDQSGVIRAAKGGPAGPGSLPVGEL